MVHFDANGVFDVGLGKLFAAKWLWHRYPWYLTRFKCDCVYLSLRVCLFIYTYCNFLYIHNLCHKHINFSYFLTTESPRTVAVDFCLPTSFQCFLSKCTRRFVVFPLYGIIVLHSLHITDFLFTAPFSSTNPK